MIESHERMLKIVEAVTRGETETATNLLTREETEELAEHLRKQIGDLAAKILKDLLGTYHAQVPYEKRVLPESLTDWRAIDNAAALLWESYSSKMNAYLNVVDQTLKFLMKEANRETLPNELTLKFARCDLEVSALGFILESHLSLLAQGRGNMADMHYDRILYQVRARVAQMNSKEKS